MKDRLMVPSNDFKYKGKYTTEDNELFKPSEVFDALLNIAEFKKIQNKRRGLSAKKTNIEKYGVANGHDLKVNEKIRQTSLKKYGTEHPWQSETIKQKSEQTKFERYKDRHYTNREKCWETTKKNGWYKTSLEDRYFPLLKEKFPDIIQHYVSDKYPFECDFYITSLDIFIEFNGIWTHGPHAFNKESIDDINLLNEWKIKSNNSNFYNKYIFNNNENNIKRRKYRYCIL